VSDRAGDGGVLDDLGILDQLADLGDLGIESPLLRLGSSYSLFSRGLRRSAPP
jgi:hypothetical protein